MRMRFFGIALGFLLVPAVALADGHRAGFYGGGSGASGSSMWGFHTTADFTFYDFTNPQSKLRYVGVLDDFSVLSGTHNGADVTI